MYPNLNAELARRDLTLAELSEKTGIRYSTLMQKARGETEFKVSEAMKIKEVLGTALPIDDLFSTEIKE